ncbi:hypothetical protein KKF34_03950 [Myxococcota bacterium]|nr:hypothetical protein [Myxococcota bacterium]MBU1382713.1 hypothetical protein [Myxococcota bacterium]MBU1496009.1 hypothetical protein [Myxococcota bacterium]
MKFTMVISVFLLTSCLTPETEENWTLLVNYSPSVKYDSGPILQFDSAVNPHGVFLLEMVDSGICNPLCPGICKNNRCFRSQIDEDFYNDAKDGELSSQRKLMTIPVTIEPMDKNLFIKPQSGTLRPDSIYEILLTSSLRNNHGYPVKDTFGDSVPFSLPFQTEKEDIETAQLVSVWPENGARNIPQNTAWILIESPSLSSGSIKSGDLYLESTSGETMELAPDTKIVSCGSKCLMLWLEDILDSDTEYYIKSRYNIFLPDGKLIPSWDRIGAFKTGNLLWSWDPQFTDVQMSGVTGCTHFNSSVNSDVLMWIKNEEGFSSPVSVFNRGEIEIGTRDIGRIEIYYIGVNGVSGKLGRFDVEVEDEWNPTLAITELYPNAFGPEPAMEYIAVKNISFNDLNLQGFRITDDLEKTGEILPDFILLGGDTVYIVGENYDFMSEEAACLEGKDIIITEGSLLSSGMTNSGETVWLIDPDENIISRYGGWIDVSNTPGAVVMRIDPHGCDVRDRWTTFNDF